MKFKDMNVSSTDLLMNPTGLGSVVLNPSEDVKKRIRDKEEEIEELKMDIKNMKKKYASVELDIEELKSKIKKLEAKKQASTLAEDEKFELSNATELRITLEKSHSACLNELSLLRAQLMKEEDALKHLQSSSGVSEITKVVQSGFETQAGFPSELETANLYTADEIAANDLAEALSYGLIDASHPLLKTREGCKAYVKFKESFASSDQCLSLCFYLASCSAIYFQII